MDFTSTAQDLQKAVADVGQKKVALDRVSNQIAAAQADYDKALAVARDAHDKFQKLLGDILPPVSGKRINA